MRFLCLYEQSGVFRDELRSRGFEAYDIDIKNDYGKTDYIIDLNNKNSHFFKSIKETDIIIAFPPCTFFSTQKFITIAGHGGGQKKWDILQKMEYCEAKSQERLKSFLDFCELFKFAINKKCKMIVENPYNLNGQNFLRQNFPIEPSLIIKNRADLGDKFAKPTAFWFVNCEPKITLIPQSTIKPVRVLDFGRGGDRRRSEFTREFAKNFLDLFVL